MSIYKKNITIILEQNTKIHSFYETESALSKPMDFFGIKTTNRKFLGGIYGYVYIHVYVLILLR